MKFAFNVMIIEATGHLEIEAETMEEAKEKFSKYVGENKIDVQKCPGRQVFVDVRPVTDIPMDDEYLPIKAGKEENNAAPQNP